MGRALRSWMVAGVVATGAFFPAARAADGTAAPAAPSAPAAPAAPSAPAAPAAPSAPAAPAAPSAPAAAAAPSVTSGAVGAAATTTGAAVSLPQAPKSDFNRELLAVEDQVEALKQRVFQSRATLQYLREIVVQGGAAGARLTVWHDNRLSVGYRLESVTYQLDGQTRFAKVDPGEGLTENRKFKIQEGTVPPGRHSLTVDMTVRPTGFGVFTYAKGYTVGVKGTYAFDIDLGQSCSVVSALSDRGNVANTFEERAHIDFEWKCEKVMDADVR